MASLLVMCALPQTDRLSAVATGLALIAVSGGTVYAASRQRSEQANFNRILSVVRRVSSSLDASQVLAAIVATAREATGAKASSVRLLDRDGRTLVVRAADGLSRAYMDKGPVDVRRSPIDRKVLNGEVVQILNAATDPLFQYPEQAREEGIASIVCVPLSRNGSAIGVLRVYTARPRRFTDSEVRILQALAAQAVIALRHAELHEATLSFMRKVAHELRAPLSAISTNLKVLLEGITGSLTAKQVEMLQRADRRASLMLSAVSDLLSLSRARLEKPPEAGMQLRLQDSLQTVASLMRAQAESGQVALHVEVHDDVPPVVANPDEMEELLSNLLSNAIKYTPPGGRVSAEVLMIEQRPAVRIADTGIGIPQDELPRLFEEFHRCSNARNSPIIGTGLGMAIVKTIADRHKAEIRVHSQESKGTTVEVVFPGERT